MLYLSQIENTAPLFTLIWHKLLILATLFFMCDFGVKTSKEVNLLSDRPCR